MNSMNDIQFIRRIVAVLRITVGVILLVTWYDNLVGGIYTADGMTGLFNYIFNDNGGGPAFYRALLENTILQAPGLFAGFQLIAELAMGLGLFVGLFTPLAGLGALLFFFNLFLAYFGGSEWIWTYALLASSAFVIAFSRSGRAFGLDRLLADRYGEPRFFLLW